MTDGWFLVSCTALVIASTQPALRKAGEIDHDLGPWGDRAGDLDVEHHLAVGAVLGRNARVVRVVLCTVGGDGLDRRLGNAEAAQVLLEIRLKVVRVEPAAELQQADALAGAVQVGREVIDLGQLWGEERDDGRLVEGGRMRVSDPPLDQPPVVQAGHDCDDAGEFGGDLDLADPAPVGVAGLLGVEHLELGAEGRGYVFDGPLDDDHPLAGLGLDDAEVMGLGELDHLVDVGGIGAVSRDVLGVGLRGRPLGREHRTLDGRVGNRVPGSYLDRNPDDLLGVGRANGLERRTDVFHAAAERHAVRSSARILCHDLYLLKWLTTVHTHAT